MKLNISSQRVGEALSCTCSRINAAIVAAQRLDAIPNLTVTRKGGPLHVVCDFIGFSGDAYYLNVMPEAIWLLPDESVTVTVISNVKWTIE